MTDGRRAPRDRRPARNGRRRQRRRARAGGRPASRRASSSWSSRSSARSSTWPTPSPSATRRRSRCWRRGRWSWPSSSGRWPPTACGRPGGRGRTGAAAGRSCWLARRRRRGDRRGRVRGRGDHPVPAGERPVARPPQVPRVGRQGPSARLGPRRATVPPSSRGLGRHPFKVEIRGSNPLGGTTSAGPARHHPALLPSAAMEIMGVQIRTIISDNVAKRCDGCREVIEGTPWRVNLLDIVTAETPVSWTARPAINPGPVPVPRRRRVRPALDGGSGLPVLPPGRGPRDHAARSPSRAWTTPPDDGVAGPVRRHPPRRSRVRPRLTDGLVSAVRELPFDTAPRAALSSARPGEYLVPRFTQVSPCRRAAQPSPPTAGPPVGATPLARGSRVPDVAATATRDGRWLSLGPASRLLGIDPDTLRRWADEGRVEAWTTPGGHRRFDRRALERLATDRRRGIGRPLASMGASPERLNRVYRRHYAADAAARSAAVRSPRDDVEREAYRQDGRRLIAALIDFLDSDADDARDARPPRGRGPRDRGRPGRPDGRGRQQPDRGGLELRRGPPAVPRRAGRARPRAARSTRRAWRRSTATRPRCSTGCCCASSRRISGPTRPRVGDRGLTRWTASRSVLLPARHLAPRAGLQPRPVRPVARAARRLPAHLGHRDAVLRHRRGRRGARRRSAAGTRRCTARGT